mmetsp:Transcript_3177/g.7452  ORF Transcript_3177/g.7452 Transcript_3177/m.7452 type:complete len:1450 (-) Transcript_3177:1142-5491(-)|eukprot:CAMPEP_0178996750 /NCGR_PEP_ID=MMETSP0795-20121207/8545_1 /TAXON_ID=88552 /ORGANISM="Amoebophrya sp., Strain Ameob2" /LENGTH=1449 /DNA_ID=CAMNT_0020689181 /DNA_START=1353 /DNA_END=5702 /DNA_ORIENTATION=-
MAALSSPTAPPGIASPPPPGISIPGVQSSPGVVPRWALDRHSPPGSTSMGGNGNQSHNQHGAGNSSSNINMAGGGGPPGQPARGKRRVRGEQHLFVEDDYLKLDLGQSRFRARDLERWSDITVTENNLSLRPEMYNHVCVNLAGNYLGPSGDGVSYFVSKLPVSPHQKSELSLQHNAFNSKARELVEGIICRGVFSEIDIAHNFFADGDLLGFVQVALECGRYPKQTRNGQVPLMLRLHSNSPETERECRARLEERFGERVRIADSVKEEVAGGSIPAVYVDSRFGECLPRRADTSSWSGGKNGSWSGGKGDHYQHRDSAAGKGGHFEEHYGRSSGGYRSGSYSMAGGRGGSHHQDNYSMRHSSYHHHSDHGHHGHHGQSRGGGGSSYNHGQQQGGYQHSSGHNQHQQHSDNYHHSDYNRGLVPSNAERDFSWRDHGPMGSGAAGRNSWGSAAGGGGAGNHEGGQQPQLHHYNNMNSTSHQSFNAPPRPQVPGNGHQGGQQGQAGTTSALLHNKNNVSHEPMHSIEQVEQEPHRRYQGVMKSVAASNQGTAFINCPAFGRLFDRDVFVSKEEFQALGSSCRVEPGDQVAFSVVVVRKDDKIRPQARNVVKVVGAGGAANGNGNGSASTPLNKPSLPFGETPSTTDITNTPNLLQQAPGGMQVPGQLSTQKPNSPPRHDGLPSLPPVPPPAQHQQLPDQYNQASSFHSLHNAPQSTASNAAGLVTYGSFYTAMTESVGHGQTPMSGSSSYNQVEQVSQNQQMMNQWGTGGGAAGGNQGQYVVDQQQMVGGHQQHTQQSYYHGGAGNNYGHVVDQQQQTSSNLPSYGGMLMPTSSHGNGAPADSHQQYVASVGLNPAAQVHNPYGNYAGGNNYNSTTYNAGTMASHDQQQNLNQGQQTMNNYGGSSTTTQHIGTNTSDRDIDELVNGVHLVSHPDGCLPRQYFLPIKSQRNDYGRVIDYLETWLQRGEYDTMLQHTMAETLAWPTTVQELANRSPPNLAEPDDGYLYADPLAYFVSHVNINQYDFRPELKERTSVMMWGLLAVTKSLLAFHQCNVYVSYRKFRLALKLVDAMRLGDPSVRQDRDSFVDLIKTRINAIRTSGVLDSRLTQCAEAFRYVFEKKVALSEQARENGGSEGEQGLRGMMSGQMLREWSSINMAGARGSSAAGETGQSLQSGPRSPGDGDGGAGNSDQQSSQQMLGQSNNAAAGGGQQHMTFVNAATTVHHGGPAGGGGGGDLPSHNLTGMGQVVGSHQEMHYGGAANAEQHHYNTNAVPTSAAGGGGDPGPFSSCSSSSYDHKGVVGVATTGKPHFLAPEHQTDMGYNSSTSEHQLHLQQSFQQRPMIPEISPATGNATGPSAESGSSYAAHLQLGGTTTSAATTSSSSNNGGDTSARGDGAGGATGVSGAMNLGAAAVVGSTAAGSTAASSNQGSSPNLTGVLAAGTAGVEPCTS